MKDQTKIIAALLVGAAAGAVISLLVTSDKGAEIKEEIADHINELIERSKNKAQKAANELLAYGGNVSEMAKSKINNLAGGVADYKGQIADAVVSAINSYTEQATDNTDNAVISVKSKVKNIANDLNGAIQKL
jgi:gas vesicle protein